MGSPGPTEELAAAWVALEAGGGPVETVSVQAFVLGESQPMLARLANALAGQRCAASLKKLAVVRSGLDGLQARDVVVPALKACVALKSLRLGFRGFADEFAVGVAKPLAEHGRIRDVLLDNNGITDVGARAWAEVIRGSTSLNGLGFFNDPLPGLTDAGVLELANAMRASHGNFEALTFEVSGRNVTGRSLARLQEARSFVAARHRARPAATVHASAPPAWHLLEVKPIADWTEQDIDSLCNARRFVRDRVTAPRLHRLLLRLVRHGSSTQLRLAKALISVETPKWTDALRDSVFKQGRRYVINGEVRADALAASWFMSKRAASRKQRAAKVACVGALNLALASCGAGEIESDVASFVSELTQCMRRRLLPSPLEAALALFAEHASFPQDGDHHLASRILGFLVSDASRVFAGVFKSSVEVPVVPGFVHGHALMPPSGRLALLVDRPFSCMATSLTWVDDAPSAREVVQAVVRDFPLHPFSRIRGSAATCTMSALGTTAIVTYDHYAQGPVGAPPRFLVTVFRPLRLPKQERTFPLPDAIEEVRGLCLVRAPKLPPRSSGGSGGTCSAGGSVQAVDEEILVVVYGERDYTFVDLFSAEDGQALRDERVWKGPVRISPEVLLGTMAAHPCEALTLALDADGREVWRVRLGKLVVAEEDDDRGREARFGDLASLARKANDGEERVWDDAMEFSPDGKWLAFVNAMELCVVEFDTARAVWRWKYQEEYDRKGAPLKSFSPSGKWFVVAWDFEFRVFAVGSDGGPHPEPAHVSPCPSHLMTPYHRVMWPDATDKAVVVTTSPVPDDLDSGADSESAAAKLVVLRVWV